jgi:hypothetical protein
MVGFAGEKRWQQTAWQVFGMIEHFWRKCGISSA